MKRVDTKIANKITALLRPCKYDVVPEVVDDVVVVDIDVVVGFDVVVELDVVELDVVVE